MNPTDRKIRNLNLNLADKSSATRNVALLEDAFNRFSLPGISPNCLVFIRSLSFKYPHEASSSLLTHIITEHIRHLTPRAACGDNYEKTDSPIVWFSDSNRPYIVLGNLVLRGKTPRAWYWCNLLPQLTKESNPQKIFEALIFKVHSLSQGRLTITEFIESFISSGLTGNLFQFLTSDVAEHFLSIDHIRYDEPTIDLPLYTDPFPFNTLIPKEWRDTVFRAATIWGASDSRTLWLTYNAMIRKNPSLAGSTQATSLIKQVIFDFLTLSKDTQLISTTNGSATPKSQNTINLNEGSSSDCSTIGDADPHISRFSPSNTLDTPSHQAFEDKPARTTDSSSYAGLVFLIRFLETLGIQKILQAQPKLALINFPVVVLRSLMDRFNVPQKDPIRRILPEPISIEEPSIHNFIAPAQWIPLAFNSTSKPKIIHRHVFSSNTNKIIYSDSKNIIALRVYSNNEYCSFPDTLKAQIREIKHKHDFTFTIQNLVSTFHFLLGKLARKLASLSLRTLTHRKGKVSVTKTHLDLLLNSDMADVRIRRSGIDIDPGWVAWLGKIVQYHYESGEVSNAQVR